MYLQDVDMMIMTICYFRMRWQELGMCFTIAPYLEEFNNNGPGFGGYNGVHYARGEA